jgi:7-keto-8-aminopelargonate synthetase-like enzyme
MSKHNPFHDTVYDIITDGVTKGILHLNTEDQKLSGNLIHINGQTIVNFGSCSYLGLEFESELKVAAKKAIDDYGTQFSASRAYISPRHYVELEEKFDKIFDAPSLVAPTTTLGHIATIPMMMMP